MTPNNSRIRYDLWHDVCNKVPQVSGSKKGFLCPQFITTMIRNLCRGTKILDEKVGYTTDEEKTHGKRLKTLTDQKRDHLRIVPEFGVTRYSTLGLVSNL